MDMNKKRSNNNNDNGINNNNNKTQTAHPIITKTFCLEREVEY